MPRYLVERRIPTGLEVTLGEHGMSRVAEANRYAEVAWLHSYVTADTKIMFCLYEADSPEAIRKAARRAGLPIAVIHRVNVLDPYGVKVPGPGPENTPTPSAPDRDGAGDELRAEREPRPGPGVGARDHLASAE